MIKFLHEKKPDKYRAGIGLYVQFADKDSADMFAIDKAGGDTFTYKGSTIIITKRDPDGTKRQIRINGDRIEYSREQVISIPYDKAKK